MSIRELYHQLRSGPSLHSFTAIRIPNCEGTYLAIDKEGRPCLFVETDERVFDAPLRTAQVVLSLGQEYELAPLDSSQTRQLFHSLCCESNQSSDVEAFLSLINAFLSSNTGRSINGSNLSSFFRALVRLFSLSPSKDVEGERQGLWGELFVMGRVRGFSFWAPYWHSEIKERFDFSAPGRRVEVKTTASTERVHHFSHRQIYSSHGEYIMIASLMLRENNTGLSLRELIIDCKSTLLGSPFYLKIERAVRSAKMHDTSESGPVFDPKEAERSLAWFRADDAPHFRVPEPAGVSETRYKVDLSVAPQLNQNVLEEWLDTWPEVLPELARM